MKLRRYIYILLPLLMVLLHTSCKKNIILISGGELSFSADTVMFDTVFTAYGSFTTQLKIYNKQDQPINISSVRLEQGDKSYFHLNVNGFEGNLVKDIEIAPNDSVYVFATVNINPNDSNNPFIINDKLIATLNGAEYAVPFMAYGQNAHYIIDSVLKTQTWGIDKPYVIIHNALVDSAETLTILKGCRIYVNADSRLYVSGTLKAVGTKKDSIIFQGNRLDRKYFGDEGYPGEWGGLYFTESSRDNMLDYVILKNCGSSTKIGGGSTLAAAIQVNFDKYHNGSGTYALTMRNTIVENSIGYGLVCFTGTVRADNCLFNTCGAQALAIFQGGMYEFNNCTFVTYGTNKVSHVSEPTVAILNYLKYSDDYIVTGSLTNTVLRNCVIWGSLENELLMDTVNVVGADYDLTLQNCLVKLKDPMPGFVKNTNCIINTDPAFKDYKNWDYRPQAGSPLRDKGIPVPGLTTDLDGIVRSGNPDIGCYEFR